MAARDVTVVMAASIPVFPISIIDHALSRAVMSVTEIAISRPCTSPSGVAGLFVFGRRNSWTQYGHEKFARAGPGEPRFNA